MWKPAFTTHGRCPYETHSRHQCKARNPPHTHWCTLYHSAGKAMWRLVPTMMSHWVSLSHYQWVNQGPRATAWWYVLRKMANPVEQWISRYSTSMPCEKPITHRAHFIRYVPYPVAPRRLSLTVGTATTMFPFTPTTATSPASLPHGGRYQYKTEPQGYIASGDGYSRRFDEIVSHIPNKTRCIDDMLHWADNLTKSFFQAFEWVDICGHNGIILNPHKFAFGADTIEFASFEITTTNVRPCKKYLQLTQYVTSQHLQTSLMHAAWFGQSTTERMLPFHQSLKPGTPFKWDSELNELFEESKSVIIEGIEEGVCRLV